MTAKTATPAADSGRPVTWNNLYHAVADIDGAMQDILALGTAATTTLEEFQGVLAKTHPGWGQFTDLPHALRLLGLIEARAEAAKEIAVAHVDYLDRAALAERTAEAGQRAGAPAAGKAADDEAAPRADLRKLEAEATALATLAGGMQGLCALGIEKSPDGSRDDALPALETMIAEAAQRLWSLAEGLESAARAQPDAASSAG